MIGSGLSFGVLLKGSDKGEGAGKDDDGGNEDAEDDDVDAASKGGGHAIKFQGLFRGARP